MVLVQQDSTFQYKINTDKKATYVGVASETDEEATVAAANVAKDAACSPWVPPITEEDV